MVRPGQVATGEWRLISLVDFSRSRRTRQALLGLKGLDPQTHSMIWRMQYLRDDEIRRQLNGGVTLPEPMRYRRPKSGRP